VDDWPQKRLSDAELRALFDRLFPHGFAGPKGYEPSAVKQDEEVTELVGLCLWDLFSDNHEVIVADGRVADIGSFRGAGAFLDEYLTRERDGWRDGDYMRFYLGTIWVSGRA
jgi:hypothetical protein